MIMTGQNFDLVLIRKGYEGSLHPSPLQAEFEGPQRHNRNVEFREGQGAATANLVRIRWCEGGANCYIEYVHHIHSSMSFGDSHLYIE